MSRWLAFLATMSLCILTSRVAFSGAPPNHVFVPDAEGDISSAAGAAIASDVSVALSQKGIQALTMANLKAQLKEQQYKELIGCDKQNGCIEEKIDSFGYADRLFFHILKLGDNKYHIEISLFSKGELRRAGKLARRVDCREEDLGAQASMLALEMYGLSKPGERRNGQEKWTPDSGSPWSEPK